LPGGEAFRDHMNTLDDCRLQSQLVADFFDTLNQRMDRLPAPVLDNLSHNKHNDLETVP
jgi:tRNA-dihydrouridine synthase B